ncbi:MAG: tetratricopeptide repeat-containing sulfotransferase family protein [Alphaproteobacteria bacterium]
MVNNLSKLNDLISTANYAKAEFYLYDLLKQSPNDYNLNKNLGMVLLAQNKYLGALKSFNKCYLANNQDIEIILNLSFIFLKIQDHEQCIKFSEEALNIDPESSGIYQNLANCYLEMHQFAKALDFAEKAINIRGGINSEETLKYDDFLNLYADILLAIRDVSKFISFCENILNKKVFSPDIFLKLLKEDKTKITIDYIEAIKDTINQSDKIKNNVEKNATLASANICLAEYNKKDKKLAEQYFIKANDHIATMQRSPIYVRQQMYVNLVNYFKVFDDKTILEKINPNKGKGLIFIIGMPRSGTTLTESILSSADDTIAGGEKVFFTNNLWSIFSELDTDQKLNPDYIEELGDRYLDTINLHRNGKENFIDKMPANFLYHKFIKLALPSAKFVHVYRDPWDNAISLFKANYQETIIYSSSFFGIATEYSNYSHLMKFWESHSESPPFLNVSYEELVSNTDEMVKKLWDYCNLKGEFSSEKRKSHYANTASQQQVSQDIYKTSLKKDEFDKYKDQFYSDMKQQDKYWDRLKLL